MICMLTCFRYLLNFEDTFGQNIQLIYILQLMRKYSEAQFKLNSYFTTIFKSCWVLLFGEVEGFLGGQFLWLDSLRQIFSAGTG